MPLPLDAGKANASEKLGAIMDNINGRFGTGTVKYPIGSGLILGSFTLSCACEAIEWDYFELNYRFWHSICLPFHTSPLSALYS